VPKHHGCGINWLFALFELFSTMIPVNGSLAQNAQARAGRHVESGPQLAREHHCDGTDGDHTVYYYIMCPPKPCLDIFRKTLDFRCEHEIVQGNHYAGSEEGNAYYFQPLVKIFCNLYYQKESPCSNNRKNDLTYNNESVCPY